MALNYQDRIERSPKIAGGEAVIKDTRVTLRTVLASLAEGATVDQILKDFPTLTEADVCAALGCTEQGQHISDVHVRRQSRG